MADSRVDLVKSPIGVAVKSGAPKPDISSAETIRRALLAAKSIAYSDSASGVYVSTEMFQKLGIAEEMKDKLVPNPGGSFHARRVVQGEANLAVQAEHEIRCVKGATFVPFPPVFQRTIVFVGGVGIPAGNADAATAYLAFLTGADTGNAYSAHCLPRG